MFSKFLISNIIEKKMALKESNISDFSTGCFEKFDNTKKGPKIGSTNNEINQDINNSHNFDIKPIRSNEATNLNSNENQNQNQQIEIIDKNNIIKYNKDNYAYINCFYCNSEITTKIKSKAQIFLLNRQNLPCSKCGEINFISVCQNCKYIQQIKRFVSEGEAIKCSNTLCNFEYLSTLCPIKYCPEMFYFFKNKTSENSPNGIIHIHKANEIEESEQIIFQKISCYYCLRPIVFISTESNRNMYFESMRVECPYKNCKKSFNRLVCPNPRCCNIIYMQLGLFRMGQRIKCQKCDNIFSKILCVSCLRMIPLEKNIFKYGQLECRYNSCSKKNNYAICLHCDQLNFFKNLEMPLIPGQTIQCGNKNCKKFFNIVYCPGCHELNPFPKGDFVFGRPYKCKYTAICSKTFLILICPNCYNYSRMVDDVEGKKYTCNKCNKLLANFQCPHCAACILDKNSSFNFGQMIQCPSCLKLFSFFRCYDCKRLIYSKKEILGKLIECQYCHKNSVNIICPKCKLKISYSKRDSDIIIGEEISCPSCQQKFNFADKLGEDFDKIYSKDLIYVKTLIGSTLNYGKPDEDENYLERIRFIDNENIQRKIKRNDLCLICQSNKKESIFFPCGHRCSCYECAVLYFEVHKKCPKCYQNAEAIIPKIYNT